MVKPRVLALLVFAGLASAIVAGGRGTDPWGLLIVLVGGLLSVGAANILNNVLDRDRDSLMERTMWRPIPAGTVGPRAASAAALAMGAAGVSLIWVGLNALTALLTVAGVLFYILVYTVLLKPRTPENIVIGGFAGMFPPLVGWAAVTGTVSWQPALIGVLIVLWTPPHFWSLALLYEEDYRRAGVPMLPVVAGEAATRQRIVAYTVALVMASMAYPYGMAGGWVYLMGAVPLGVLILALAGLLLARGTHIAARGLFKASSVYLAVLLAAMVADRLLGP